jgi:hypothetical protein
LSLAWLIGQQWHYATLTSTDVNKTANTPSIKAYIDNSSEFTGYTGTVLLSCVKLTFIYGIII